MAQLAINLINLVAGALYILIFARILISWLPVHPWHPVVRWLRIIVDPILAPFRRMLPSFAGIDLSPLLAILVIYLVANIATQLIAALAFGAPTHIGGTIIAFVGLLLQRIVIVLGILVLIRFLISLFSVSSFHPLVMGIRSMTDPLVRPFAGMASPRQRYGYHQGIDVPALITLAVYVILYLVIGYVFGALLNLG